MIMCVAVCIRSLHGMPSAVNSLALSLCLRLSLGFGLWMQQTLIEFLFCVFLGRHRHYVVQFL